MFHHWHHAYAKATEHFSNRIQDNPETTALNINSLKMGHIESHILYTVRRFQLLKLISLHSNQVVGIKMH